MERLNDDTIMSIIDKCDYPTLKALANTNKRILALITQKFDHEAIVASRVLGEQKDKRLFIEKLYHLNSYQSADPRGITITGTTWTKGNNSIKDDNYWYIDGKFHRYDGPARSIYDRNSAHLSWFNHGNLHRSDGPAEITRNLEYLTHIWCRNGDHHRDDGPAIISQDFNEDRYVEAWFINDKRHRKGGPASLVLENGRTLYEEWYMENITGKMVQRLWMI